MFKVDKRAPLDVPVCTPNQREALVSGYVAYWGTYPLTLPQVWLSIMCKATSGSATPALTSADHSVSRAIAS